MEFVEILLVLVMLLIFIVIIYNIFAHGRDLVIFPPKMRKVRDSERYPGSPEYDEYTDDEDSDSDDEDYNQKYRKNKKHHGNIHPSQVAHYVSSHMSD